MAGVRLLEEVAGTAAVVPGVGGWGCNLWGGATEHRSPSNFFSAAN